MGAPARVLPTEHNTAPRLTLVDNIGIGDTIVAEAKKQQAQLIDLPTPDRQQVPVNRRRPRRVKDQTHRNGPVIVTQTRYRGPVNPMALGVAQLIQARHGGYIRIINSTTVKVVNHPPEG